MSLTLFVLVLSPDHPFLGLVSWLRALVRARKCLSFADPSARWCLPGGRVSGAQSPPSLPTKSLFLVKGNRREPAWESRLGGVLWEVSWGLETHQV